ncbi:fimbrial protein [Actinomyces sp. Z5]|uniref:SpaH/EbpB family LPXTG-anchored major pilin n=1 Tax=Actinomyces sp. Z5 TaxID=2250216 RepID=UPI000DCE4F55|nr:SpaH/EbpB family LPXTG-anchored major pilin [Actinomyces sp. Z5]RAX19733.1 fimbrial protein [Actinomyces sp. Z5]
MSSLTRRRGAGLAAAVALAIGGMVAAPVATAAPTPAILAAAEATDLDTALIDADRASTLTIHKLAQTETNGTSAGNGLEDTSATGDAVEGVTFTVTKLNFDLTTQAGWQQLAALNGSAAEAAGYKTATVFTQTTDGDGLATFSNLEVGAYLVSETKAPQNVTTAEDFVVTVPMTNPNGSEWNYDVHVYPKNSVVDSSKEVSDNGSPTIGDTVTYTIKADIPKIDVDGGATIKNYQIVDPLDPRLQYQDTTVTMLGTGAQELEGTDYEIVTAVGSDGKTYVTVTFTADGRAKIASARADGDTSTQVQVVINATIKAIGNGNGSISNTSFLIPNDSQTTWDPNNPNPEDVPGEPSDEVKSYYGKVTINKTGTDGKAASTYAGAEFQVYECNPTGATQGATIDRDAANITGAALTANQVTAAGTVENTAKFTTGSDGKVTIDALRTNDFINNAAVTNPGWYCLVETKAPTGYEIQSDPIAFQVLRADVEASPYAIDFTVIDVPSNAGFRLPLTGANGIIFLTIAGILLVAGAVLLTVHNKRRSAQA